MLLGCLKYLLIFGFNSLVSKSARSVALGSFSKIYSGATRSSISNSLKSINPSPPDYVQDWQFSLISSQQIILLCLRVRILHQHLNQYVFKEKGCQSLLFFEERFHIKNEILFCYLY